MIEVLRCEIVRKGNRPRGKVSKKALSFSGNDMGNAGIKILTKIIRTNMTIEELIVNGTDLMILR